MTYAGTMSAEQRAATDKLRDGWMTTALSTERCDRPAAEAAVHEAYRAAGLEVPPLTIWMDSPLGGVFASTVLREHLFKPGAKAPGQLWGQLRGQLWDQLWDQLGDQLRDQLWGQLGDAMANDIYSSLSPWWDAYWATLYTRALDVAAIEPSPRLEAITAAIWQTGWWWPTRGAAILTDRPTVIERDQQARLHCETGPALAYADGYAGHWWHGVRVPADLVTGDGWAPDRILKEPNAEIRRCAIEKRGWDRFVVDAGLAQVEDNVPDPGNPGRELALYDVPAAIYDEPVRVLLCTNGSADRDGTIRRFGLTVPADIPDPVAAAAWTYDVSPAEYAGLARRT